MPAQPIPDAAVVLALSKVELSVDTVLDAMRSPDPFGIRTMLAEYTAQEQPNLAERGLIAAIERVLRMKVPGHAEWPAMPLAERCDWWVERLGWFAAVVAGLPRLSGAAADRLPIQDSLGAAVQASVICAICREYGVDDHADRTSVLVRILTDREITPVQVREYDDPQSAAREVAEELELDRLKPGGEEAGFRSTLRLLWRIGRMITSVDSVLEDRPRGSLGSRILGKVPVVGVLGGYADERGGIRKAAYQAGELLSSGAFRTVTGGLPDGR